MALTAAVEKELECASGNQAKGTILLGGFSQYNSSRKDRMRQHKSVQMIFL